MIIKTTGSYQAWSPVRRKVVRNARFEGVRSQIKYCNIHIAGTF